LTLVHTSGMPVSDIRSLLLSSRSIYRSLLTLLFRVPQVALQTAIDEQATVVMDAVSAAAAEEVALEFVAALCVCLVLLTCC